MERVIGSSGDGRGSKQNSSCCYYVLLLSLKSGQISFV